ncbi:hypothetical protein HU200_041750 [Digitaria exilis]|uniref:Uncharacterized protein n=1 Tax=Digitaria exilis TaxID=1010633 RepID=A0A835EGF4_9POAL|nr:hypothetical protein HU200_041750 [Digitaria exilis]
MIICSRQAFGSTIYREIVIIAVWCIWCHRNSIIFDGQCLSFAAWRRCFRQEVDLVTLRVNPELKDKLVSFVSSL